MDSNYERLMKIPAGFLYFELRSCSLRKKLKLCKFAKNTFKIHINCWKEYSPASLLCLYAQCALGCTQMCERTITTAHPKYPVKMLAYKMVFEHYYMAVIWKISIDASTASPDRLNVIIFGLESLSRSNFIRNLPLTHRVCNFYDSLKIEIRCIINFFAFSFLHNTLADGCCEDITKPVKTHFQISWPHWPDRK